MKTEFLKDLGITDQNVIDSIMAANGKDIEKAKGELETYKAKVSELETEIGNRDSQLKELKATNKDNEELTAKIAKLEENNKTAKDTYESKIKAMELDYTLEMKLRDAKAKNVKAVKALIDVNEDLDKQVKTLQSDESTAFLFDIEKNIPPAPKGTEPSVGKPATTSGGQLSLAEAIGKALNMKG